jgi:hypothetical protein
MAVAIRHTTLRMVKRVKSGRMDYYLPTLFESRVEEAVALRKTNDSSLRVHHYLVICH